LRQAVTEPSDPSDSDRALLDLSDSLERSLSQRSGEILDAEEILLGEAPDEASQTSGRAPGLGRTPDLAEPFMPGSGTASDLAGGPAPGLDEPPAIPALGLTL
jgi:hypothetical protein